MMTIMSKKTAESGEIPYFELVNAIEGHASSVYSISTCKDFIYSASGDRYICRWNTNSGEQDPFAIKLENTSYSIKVLESQDILIVGLSNGLIHVFDLIEKKEIKCFDQHRSAIFSMEFNDDRSHLYIGDREGYLSVWNSISWDLQMVIPLGEGKIRAITYASDQKLLFVGRQNGEISVFDTEYYNELRTYQAHEGGVSTLFFCDEKKVLISGGNDAHIRIWDDNGKPMASIPAHNYTVYSILRFESDLYVSSSKDGSIKIWSGLFEKVIQKIDKHSSGHRNSVNGLLKISNDGIASCSDDASIKCFRKVSP